MLPIASHDRRGTTWKEERGEGKGEGSPFVRGNREITLARERLSPEVNRLVRWFGKVRSAEGESIGSPRTTFEDPDLRWGGGRGEREREGEREVARDDRGCTTSEV